MSNNSVVTTVVMANDLMANDSMANDSAQSIILVDVASDAASDTASPVLLDSNTLLLNNPLIIQSYSPYNLHTVTSVFYILYLIIICEGFMNAAKGARAIVVGYQRKDDDHGKNDGWMTDYFITTKAFAPLVLYLTFAFLYTGIGGGSILLDWLPEPHYTVKIFLISTSFMIELHSRKVGVLTEIQNLIQGMGIFRAVIYEYQNQFSGHTTTVIIFLLLLLAPSNYYDHDIPNSLTGNPLKNESSTTDVVSSIATNDSSSFTPISSTTPGWLDYHRADGLTVLLIKLCLIISVACRKGKAYWNTTIPGVVAGTVQDTSGMLAEPLLVDSTTSNPTRIPRIIGDSFEFHDQFLDAINKLRAQLGGDPVNRGASTKTTKTIKQNLKFISQYILCMYGCIQIALLSLNHVLGSYVNAGEGSYANAGDYNPGLYDLLAYYIFSSTYVKWASFLLIVFVIIVEVSQEYNWKHSYQAAAISAFFWWDPLTLTCPLEYESYYGGDLSPSPKGSFLSNDQIKQLRELPSCGIPSLQEQYFGPRDLVESSITRVNYILTLLSLQIAFMYVYFLIFTHFQRLQNSMFTAVKDLIIMTGSSKTVNVINNDRVQNERESFSESQGENQTGTESQQEQPQEQPNHHQEQPITLEDIDDLYQGYLYRDMLDGNPWYRLRVIQRALEGQV